MIWIILGLIIISVLYTNYVNDKRRLHNKIVLKGGMNEVFEDFLNRVNNDFENFKIIKMTETELEFASVYNQSVVLFWGIKYGFSEVASFKVDTSAHKNHINALAVVTAGVNRQVECYETLIKELANKKIIE